MESHKGKEKKNEEKNFDNDIAGKYGVCDVGLPEL